MTTAISRRAFVCAGAFAAGAGLPGSWAAEAGAKPRVKLAISSYSYWHFRTAKVPIETVIDKAAALGISGVDVLHRQMEIPEKAALDAAGLSCLRKLKRHIQAGSPSKWKAKKIPSSPSPKASPPSAKPFPEKFRP